eukprot:1595052-Lingulodinium_polyedra.AAC.1
MVCCGSSALRERPPGVVSPSGTTVLRRPSRGFGIGGQQPGQAGHAYEWLPSSGTCCGTERDPAPECWRPRPVMPYC